MKLIFVAILLFTLVATTVVYHKTQSSDIDYYKAHRYFEKLMYYQVLQTVFRCQTKYWVKIGPLFPVPCQIEERFFYKKGFCF